MHQSIGDAKDKTTGTKFDRELRIDYSMKRVVNEFTSQNL